MQTHDTLHTEYRHTALEIQIKAYNATSSYFRREGDILFVNALHFEIRYTG